MTLILKSIYKFLTPIMLFSSFFDNYLL